MTPKLASLRLLVTAAALGLAGCGEPPRVLHTLDEALAAEVPGFEGIRFYADMSAGQMPGLTSQFLPDRPADTGSQSFLALSTGGEGGAYGAGYLLGWTARGDRPDFDLVTGISAGALIAPFAFAGEDYDYVLADLFDADTAVRLNGSRSVLRGLFGESVLDGAVLRALIDEHLTDALMTRIAQRHRAGARLLVVTTDMDAERSVVWNLGAIAAAASPNARHLFGDVLQASASIPGIFPPVRLPVAAGGRSFDEMHADGGALRQIYLFPDTFLDDIDPAGQLWRNLDISVIFNRPMTLEFRLTEDRAVAVASRALSGLERASARTSLGVIAHWARGTDSRLQWVAIDPSVLGQSAQAFDPAYMGAAFALGRRDGTTGNWHRGPPTASWSPPR